MSDLRYLDVLLTAHTKATLSLAEMAVRQLAALWITVDQMKPEGGAWYDGDLVRAAGAQAAMVMQTAINESRTEADAYIEQVLTELDIDWPEVEEIHTWEYEREERSDVLIDEVAERPAEQRRYQTSIGKTDEEALAAAIDRAGVIAETDLADASRSRSQQVYRATAEITGYRRVIRPELSKTGTCGLCAVASHQRYRLDELMPIHDRCKCQTMPITEDEDPGGAINRADLNRLYEAAGSTLAQDLKRVRLTTGEHGELGPLLTEHGIAIPAGSTRPARKKAPKKQASKTRREAPRSGETSAEQDKRLAKREAQAQVLQDSLENLKIRQSKGEKDLEEAIRWQTDRISRLTQEIWDLRFGK